MSMISKGNRRFTPRTIAHNPAELRTVRVPVRRRFTLVSKNLTGAESSVSRNPGDERR